MYKFRLVVYYVDETAYRDLLRIAHIHKVSFSHNQENRAVIFFINDVILLTQVSRDIEQFLE